MFLGNHRSKLNLRPRVGDESKRSIQRRPVTKDWRDIKRSEAKKKFNRHGAAGGMVHKVSLMR